MELTVGGGGGEGAGVADHWRLLSIGERNHFVGKLLDRGKDREDARLADKIFTKQSETKSKERSFASNLNFFLGSLRIGNLLVNSCWENWPKSCLL